MARIPSLGKPDDEGCDSRFENISKKVPILRMWTVTPERSQKSSEDISHVEIPVPVVNAYLT